MSRLTRRALLAGTATGAAALVLPRMARADVPVTPVAEQLQPPSQLMARKRTSLDGTWRYILDPYDAGKRGSNRRRMFWQNYAPPPTGPLVEYDWSESPAIDLPRDWNSHAAELQWYEGPVWFRRTFDHAPEPGKRYHLAFEGANYHSAVWVNTEAVGEHEGGFTPFAVDVTELLRAGENEVTVCVDSRHHPGAIPTDYTDWQNYGGITRSVWLVELEESRIEDWFVRIEGDQLVTEVWLAGPERANQPVTLAIGGQRLTGRTNGDGYLRLARRNRLALWSPEQPRLHAVRVAALGQTVEDRIGLRTIATRGRELLFNGAPLFLRGISLHEEPIGPVGTRRMTEADARRLLTEAKELGCNFVRLAHYPHGESTLRIADELGLIVWAEVPVYWEHIQYDNPATLALARKTMTAMVRRDRNRCSIGMWSVANETPITDARNAFLRALIGDTRALDPTRLLTAALNKNVDVGGAAEGQSVFKVTDPLGADLDLLAINQYEAWYSPRTPDEIAEVSFVTDFDKPLMFSEFGADALAGHLGPREHLWTEGYQAWLYEENIKLVERTEGCVGLSPWVLKDFRSPRRWHGKYQQFWNRKGLISETGVRKQAWTVLRDYYRAKAKG
ncbi:hypothetical protein J4558_03495 [Leptolyngbya sp. 15MV]|nr:hypothetical protein J4558_03495 [Leptolyngbya sp. 15MV]